MASDVEEDDMEICCWKCSQFSYIFPELLCTLNTLKIKKQRTDEESITDKMIANGSIDETNRDTMKDIIEFSVGMGYIIKSSYGDHFTYRINTEMDNGERCKVCDELLLTFDCKNYNVDPVIKYVDIDTFEAFASGFNNFKECTYENFLNEARHQNSLSTEILIKEHNDEINQLEEKIKHMSEKIDDKDKIIQILFKKNSEYFRTFEKSSATINKSEETELKRKSDNISLNVNLSTNGIPYIQEVNENDINNSNRITVQ